MPIETKIVLHKEIKTTLVQRRVDIKVYSSGAIFLCDVFFIPLSSGDARKTTKTNAQRVGRLYTSASYLYASGRSDFGIKCHFPFQKMVVIQSLAPIRRSIKRLIFFVSINSYSMSLCYSTCHYSELV